MFDYKQKTNSKVIPKAFIRGVLILFARIIKRFDA